MNTNKNIQTAVLMVLVAISASFGRLAMAAQVTHNITVGQAAGSPVSANGDMHQYRVDIAAAVPAQTETINGTTFTLATDGYYYAPATWTISQGFAAAPGWGQTQTIDPVKANDLFRGYEVSTVSPTTGGADLGYQLTVGGQRTKAGTGAGAGGPGAPVITNWGSSVSADAIESLSSSQPVTINNAPTLIVTGGSVTVTGSIAAGTSVDATTGASTDYKYTYEVDVQGPDGTMTTIRAKKTPTTDQTSPLKHATIANWNLSAQNANGRPQFAPGAYIITLRVTADTGGVSGGSSVAVTNESVSIQLADTTSGFSLSDAAATPANTSMCAAVKAPGQTMNLKAVLTPAISEAQLPANFVTWTGGSAVAGSQLQRSVDKSAWAKNTVTAKVGDFSFTMLAYVVGAKETGFNISATPQKDDTAISQLVTLGLRPNIGGQFTGNSEDQFTSQPSDFVTDGQNGYFATTAVVWRVTRRVRIMVWGLNIGSNLWAASNTERVGAEVNGVIQFNTFSDDQWASDDSGENDDKTSDPWNNAGHLYSVDGPTDNGNPVMDRLVIKDNFEDWVTVSLPGMTQAAMCSDYFAWHYYRSLVPDPNDNTTSTDSADYGGSSIGPGNDFWGDVPPIPAIATTTLPDAANNAAYSSTVATIPGGGTAPFTWSLTSGTLPPGITLSTTTGVISGTPTAAGQYSFKVKVTDNANPSQTASQQLSLAVK